VGFYVSIETRNPHRTVSSEKFNNSGISLFWGVWLQQCLSTSFGSARRGALGLSGLLLPYPESEPSFTRESASPFSFLSKRGIRIGVFRQSSSIILVYPSIGACGGNGFRHLLVQHGAAPLGYPAHYCLILNQDHLSHVNLLLLLGWIDRKID
jgi:hypothetical protein